MVNNGSPMVDKHTITLNRKPLDRYVAKCCNL